MASVYAGFSTSFDFIQGIQLDFKVFHVIYAYIKTTLFAFILATIPSYHGFFMKGGHWKWVKQVIYLLFGPVS